jgi:hypothetical protein
MYFETFLSFSYFAETPRYFITLFTMVLLRSLGGVIFDVVDFYFFLLCLTLCRFVTKRGSNFYLDRDCIFNRSSDCCPRMAKGGVC